MLQTELGYRQLGPKQLGASCEEFLAGSDVFVCLPTGSFVTVKVIDCVRHATAETQGNIHFVHLLTLCSCRAVKCAYAASAVRDYCILNRIPLVHEKVVIVHFSRARQQ